jgi:hypothetical protein
MPKRQGRGFPGALLALLCALTGCRVAEARIWNLRQVHNLDGTPRRQGRTQSDLDYLLQRSLSSIEFSQTSFSQTSFSETKPSTIHDPLGTCFKNVIALAKCNPDKDSVAALQAEGLGWLAVDCTYALSREEAARALGPLALRLEVLKAAEPDGEPSGPEEIKSAFDTLVIVASPIVRGESGSVLDLREACEGIGAVRPDRAATLLLLKATNVLLEEGGSKTALDPLRGLQRSLARRAVAFALYEVMDDADGRVAAGGLASRLLLVDEDREALLQAAIADPRQGLTHFEELALEAIEWIAANGLPRPPPSSPASEDWDEEDEAAQLERWCATLVQLLSVVRGRLHPATARALSRLTGRPATLRPELWSSWWLWERDGPSATTTHDDAPEASTNRVDD